MTSPRIPVTGGAGLLKWWHVALLRVLNERGGFTAGTLGKEVWKTTDGRSSAASATPALKELERWGYAGRLDDGRPVIWIRTPAGTAALPTP